VRKDLDSLLSEDPGLNPGSIEARLRLIFNSMQAAWSAQDLRPLRPFVSDRQYDSLQYWIDAYKEQGLRNLMARPRLDKFVFARVGRDAHYDALTLRVWASGCDYTVEANSGRVVGGSRTAPRRYSEYWTLIRSARARGTPRLDQNCPGCGVPLALNMAGGCEHCGAHLTSGEFDWVLSKIEQDEAHRG
jgi:predicted lipid-binding transport protein (Tim44 family)